MQQDCTAILVPDLDSPQEAHDYLGPLKPRLLELELESWHRDPSRWPPERTRQVFDTYLAIEVHSMVWNLVPPPTPRRRGHPRADRGKLAWLRERITGRRP